MGTIKRKPWKRVCKDTELVKGPWLRPTRPLTVRLPLLRFAPRKSKEGKGGSYGDSKVVGSLTLVSMFTSGAIPSTFPFPLLCSHSPHTDQSVQTANTWEKLLRFLASKPPLYEYESTEYGVRGSSLLTSASTYQSSSGSTWTVLIPPHVIISSGLPDSAIPGAEVNRIQLIISTTLHCTQLIQWLNQDQQ